jgi:hypothetical protein
MAENNIPTPPDGFTIINPNGNNDVPLPPQGFSLQGAYNDLKSVPSYIANTVSPQQPDNGFFSNAYNAVKSLPSGFAELVTQGNPSEINKTSQYISNALTSPSFSRMAPPIASALMTDGASTIPSLASMFTAGAGGEYVAQKQEGIQNPDVNKVIGSGIMSAGLPVGGQILDPLTGQSVASVSNFLKNLSIGVTTSEAGKYVSQGYQFETPKNAFDVAVRLGAPTLTAFIGTAAKSVNDSAQLAVKNATEISSARFGTQPLLSDVLSKYTNLEADAIARGNSTAVKLLSNIDANIGDVLKESFGDAVGQDVIAQTLTPYVGHLTTLQNNAKAAAQKAEELANAVASQTNEHGAFQSQLKDQAEKAAVDAVKQRALYDSYWQKTFGSADTAINNLDNGARITRLSGYVSAAKNAVNNGLDALYSKAGIDSNTPFVTKDVVLNSINRNISDVSDKEQMISLIKNALSKPGMADEDGNISLTALRKLKNTIANDLTVAGSTPAQASALSAKTYNVVKSASDDYMREFVSQTNPNAMEDFNTAQRAAKSVFEAQDKFATNGVVDDIMNGNIQSVLNKIQEKGYNNIKPEIDAYTGALSSMGDDASRAAAQQFSRDLNLSIRDQVLHNSSIPNINSNAGIADLIDIRKYSDNIAKLCGSSGGKYPLENLGLGNEQTLNALNRISKVEGRNSISGQDLEQFFKDVNTVGLKKATAIRQYQEAVKTSMIAGDDSIRKEALNRASSAAKIASDEADRLNQALQIAQKDPLVQLMNNARYGLNSNDTSANNAWISSLLSSGKKQVQDFVQAFGDRKLNTGSNNITIDDLRQAAVKNVIFDTFKLATSQNGQKVNLAKLTDAFYGADRDSFKALLGDKMFNDLKAKFADPASGIIKQTNTLTDTGAYNTNKYTTLLAGAVGTAQGHITGGAITGSLASRFLGLLNEQRYNVAYKLFVDPEFAPAFAKYSGDVNKFVNSNARNAVSYQIADTLDKKYNQQQRQPNQ